MPMKPTTYRRRRKLTQAQKQEYRDLINIQIKRGIASPKNKTPTPDKLYKARKKAKLRPEVTNDKDYIFMRAKPEAIKAAKAIGIRTTKNGVLVKRYGEGKASIVKDRKGRFSIVKNREDRGTRTIIPLDPDNSPNRIMERIVADAKKLKKGLKKNQRLAFRINDANGNISRNTFSTIPDLRKSLMQYAERDPELWRGFLNSIEIVVTTIPDHVRMRAALTAARSRKRFRDARERKTGK